MWSAAADPRVLTVRAEACTNGRGRRLDGDAIDRLLPGPPVERVLIECGGEAVRLDIVDGTIVGGPVLLHFNMLDDDTVEDRIGAIRMLRGHRRVRRHVQLARRLSALHAIDARDTGASLKEIAKIVLAPGDWPGDGDHRKSLVRRLVASGERMLRDGPRAILKGSDDRRR